MTAISSFLPRGLYAITPERDDDERLLAEVGAVIAGGCRLVQYRCKRADDGLRRRQVALLADSCRRNETRLIINDDVELAINVDAAGVHLGADDGDLAEARRRLGPGRLLGVSCYNEPARVDAALAAGADYIALGAMYPSSTKPAAVRASLDFLRAVKARCPVPVATIGGITLANAPALVDAGADLLAVISDLFDAPDITRRAHDFQQLFLTRA